MKDAGYRNDDRARSGRVTERKKPKLVGGQNPTTLQVACSVPGCVFWMIRNPSEGANLPDHLPHEEIMEIALPYLGPVVSQPSDWKPVPEDSVEHWDDLWQFETFLVK